MNREAQPTLCLDLWESSSLLQKAIRRGEAKLARHAAEAFHRHRGKAIWRRLLTIAFEDVGIANVELIGEISFLASDARLRAAAGSEQELIIDICERLARSPKDRCTDYLFCAATKLPFEGLATANRKVQLA